MSKRIDVAGELGTHNIVLLIDGKPEIGMPADTAIRVAVEILLTLAQHPEEPTKKRLSALLPVHGTLAAAPNGDTVIAYRLACGLELVLGFEQNTAREWARRILAPDHPMVH